MSSKKRNIDDVSSSSSLQLASSTAISELELGRGLEFVRGVIKRNGIWKLRSLRGKIIIIATLL